DSGNDDNSLSMSDIHDVYGSAVNRALTDIEQAALTDLAEEYGISNTIQAVKKAAVREKTAIAYISKILENGQAAKKYRSDQSDDIFNDIMEVE
ncbi:MAG: hypothetical protein Q4C00_05470, partial [Bacillota bacterium]|nr:hypothetical protein [Bacillota bacterium]